jgi:hypothetical protein
MNTLTTISNYMREKITNWYNNAAIDYGVQGKFIDANVDGNSLLICWEEDGEAAKLKINWYTEYSLEDLYNIWMEG